MNSGVARVYEMGAVPAESKSDVTLQLGGIGVVRNVRQDACQKRGFGASAVLHTEMPRFNA
jgi:hypothetical protein